jgi:hypothetical protein
MSDPKMLNDTPYLEVKMGLCPDSVARKGFSSFSSCRRGGGTRE